MIILLLAIFSAKKKQQISVVTDSLRSLFATDQVLDKESSVLNYLWFYHREYA